MDTQAEIPEGVNAIVLAPPFPFAHKTAVRKKGTATP